MLLSISLLFIYIIKVMWFINVVADNLIKEINKSAFLKRNEMNVKINKKYIIAISR